LIFKAPAVAETEPVRINLVEDDGDSPEDLNLESEPAKPWNEFTNKQLLPAVEELDRPLIDSEVVIERTAEKPETESATGSLADLAIPEMPKPALPPAAVDDNSFEVNAEIVDALEIEVQRREIENQPSDEIPDIDLVKDIERPQIKVEPALIDNNNFGPPESSDQVAEPFTGELVDEAARLPMTEEPLPMPPPATQMMSVSERHRIDVPKTEMKLFSSHHRLGDGKPLPDLYKLRAAENRLMVAERRGGSMQTEAAVQAALKWLAANQAADGRWDPRKTQAGKETKVFGHDRQGAGADADTGITALAVMAFMAGGHTHLEGEYQLNVQKGLEFLLRNQAVDGSLSGNARLFARTYCHSMALLAMSEALALTGDSRLIAPVQRGVDFSVYAQNKTDGGWRYQPGDRGDMSQFGWQVLAMHSAANGGIHVPMDTINRMKAFLNACCSGVGNGLAAYRPNQGVSTTMTAEALVCRYFLEDQVALSTKQQATSRLLRELPSQHHINLYYWYYGTMAMYQTGGEPWEQWNQRLKSALITTQILKGDEAGSWEPNGLWAGYGGRVYSTAMSTLCLEVYYRYLPMYEIAEAEAKAALDAFRQRQAGRIITLR